MRVRVQFFAAVVVLMLILAIPTQVSAQPNIKTLIAFTLPADDVRIVPKGDGVEMFLSFPEREVYEVFFSSYDLTGKGRPGTFDVIGGETEMEFSLGNYQMKPEAYKAEAYKRYKSNEREVKEGLRVDRLDDIVFYNFADAIRKPGELPARRFFAEEFKIFEQKTKNLDLLEREVWREDSVLKSMRKVKEAKDVILAQMEAKAAVAAEIEKAKEDLKQTKESLTKAINALKGFLLYQNSKAYADAVKHQQQMHRYVLEVIKGVEWLGDWNSSFLNHSLYKEWHRGKDSSIVDQAWQLELARKKMMTDGVKSAKTFALYKAPVKLGKKDSVSREGSTLGFTKVLDFVFGYDPNNVFIGMTPVTTLARGVKGAFKVNERLLFKKVKNSQQAQSYFLKERKLHRKFELRGYKENRFFVKALKRMTTEGPAFTTIHELTHQGHAQHEGGGLIKGNAVHSYKATHLLGTADTVELEWSKFFPGGYWPRDGKPRWQHYGKPFKPGSPDKAFYLGDISVGITKEGIKRVLAMEQLIDPVLVDSLFSLLDFSSMDHEYFEYISQPSEMMARKTVAQIWAVRFMEKRLGKPVLGMNQKEWEAALDDASLKKMLEQSRAEMDRGYQGSMFISLAAGDSKNPNIRLQNLRIFLTLPTP